MVIDAIFPTLSEVGESCDGLVTGGRVTGGLLTGDGGRVEE